MGAKTNIEWTDHTFNIAWGCIKASAGCDHCYAESLSRRFGYAWGSGAKRRIMSDVYWQKPIHWNNHAQKMNRQELVFCSSMTDVFLNDRTIDAERERLWPMIRQTPHLLWQILTKHPERIRANLPTDWGSGYHNVWLGVSVENNENRWRVDMLRDIPSRIHFLSVEPMLGPVDCDLQGIEWVICGGESGPNARPMEMQWARDLRDTCNRHGAAFFLKQLGGTIDKRGHNSAILDGREYKAFPLDAIDERRGASGVGSTYDEM